MIETLRRVRWIVGNVAIIGFVVYSWFYDRHATLNDVSLVALLVLLALDRLDSKPDKLYKNVR